MAIEYTNLPFFEWLIGPYGQGAWLHFVLVMAILIPLGTLLGFLFMAVRMGPSEAFFAVAGAYANLCKDIVNFSPRRTMAMARLAFQESLRQKVLVVFAVVALLIMIGGWFLDVESNDPARLYLGNVMWGTNMLALLLAVLLSAFSIPNDIKHHTIYTIVTKPVRYLEIVLGRVLGFSLICTLLLMGLCFANLIFVYRGIMHEHQVVAADVNEVRETVTDRESGAQEESLAAWEGETTRDSHHRHTFRVDAATGRGKTNVRSEHWHQVYRESDGTFRVGPPEDALRARVPIYGKLVFMDREGKLVDRGINVGNEWSYRSSIEGATRSAAIWEFSGIYREDFPPEDFPDGVPLELNLRVFRTHKGKMDRGVLGELIVRNPDRPDIESEPKVFETKEFVIDEHWIPHKLRKRVTVDGQEKLVEAKLFEDFVTADGRLQVIIKCAEPGQYLSMAQADVYVKADEASFSWNFVKGYMGIWMQMVLVICFGVMFSTILNGPVAMLTTIGALVLGWNREFLLRVATGDLVGGAALESTIRMVTQQNQTIELDPSATVTVAQTFDLVIRGVMWVVVQVLPDFRSYQRLYDHVSYGYDVSPDLMAQHLLITLAYAMVVVLVSYFLFRSKEVAA